jgi:hypothetical protein
MSANKRLSCVTHYLHPVPRLRIRGDKPPLTHTFSSRCVPGSRNRITAHPHCLIQDRLKKFRPLNGTYIIFWNNSMELSNSRESASYTVIQELLSILWNQKEIYRAYESAPLVPIVSQMNPVHTTPSYHSLK